jgi:hypothetical protein
MYRVVMTDGFHRQTGIDRGARAKLECHGPGEEKAGAGSSPVHHGISKAGESCRRNWHATPSSTESSAIGAELLLRTQPILRIPASASVASILAIDILWQLLARGITLRIRDDE